MLLFLSAGLALGLGIGALAEVAKKSIRHNNGSGEESRALFRAVAPPRFSGDLENMFLARAATCCECRACRQATALQKRRLL